MGTKQIQVTGELWQEVCTVGWRGTFECTEGLPEGATFHGAFYNSCLGEHLLMFIFEHPDWPEIEPGEDAPVIDVVWKKTYDDLGL